MKNIVWFLASAIVLVAVNVSLGEAGPPIPKPTHSITQAVQVVQEYFVGPFAKESGLAKNEHFKPADFLVTSVQYTKWFRKKVMEEWSWIVTLTHPVANDINYTFKLTSKGKVVLLEQTE
jgi:hypothetical protein